MITITEFNGLEHGRMFDTGILPNSPEGIFMTRDGGYLRWVATKGYGNDWAVYCHWDDNSPHWIKQHGDKLHNKEHINKCVSCDDEMFKLYRY